MSAGYRTGACHFYFNLDHMDQDQGESGILIDMHMKINLNNKAREYTNIKKFPMTK